MSLRLVLTAPMLWACLISPLRGQQADPVTGAEYTRYGESRPSAEFHRGRRQAVLEALPDDAVGIVLSAPVRNRSNDVDYQYRQASDLLYLAGITEPAAALILVPGGAEVDGRTVREILVVRERNPATEVWAGRRLGPEGAMRELGVELAVGESRFEEIVAPLLATHRPFVLPWPEGVGRSELAGQVEFLRRQVPTFESAPGRLGSLQRAMLRVRDDAGYARLVSGLDRLGGLDGLDRLQGTADSAAVSMIRAFIEAGGVEAWRAWQEEHMAGLADSSLLPTLLAGLREVKTDEELRFMQRAIDITAAAHREAFRAIEPGMREYEAEAVIEYTFRREGAEHTGFPSIVGSGENSTILHYDSNRRRMEAGDVVVMDIGAEYRGYSADVTRTVPVSGRFSDAQRRIYELVLEAQAAAIAAAVPGASFRDLNQAASAVLAEGLQATGVISNASELRRYFPHGVSHYLGLDVHDVGTYGPLRPGNVITVEPGLYIAPSDDVDPAWWNIGVRIEDDVLITDDGPVVLSAAAPKMVAEIEMLMAEPGGAAVSAAP